MNITVLTNRRYCLEGLSWLMLLIKPRRGNEKVYYGISDSETAQKYLFSEWQCRASDVYLTQHRSKAELIEIQAENKNPNDQKGDGAEVFEPLILTFSRFSFLEQ